MDLRVKKFPKLSTLPKPEEQLRSLVERAPEAEAWADRLMERLRPTLTALYGIHRRIATIAVVGLTAWLFVHVTFGANGMVVYKQKRAEYDSLQKDIVALQKENDDYTKQIDELKTDPNMIEKEAREQLHYARPGDVVFVPPPSPPPPPRPEKNTASK
jgi:cell division protein FtsB